MGVLGEFIERGATEKRVVLLVSRASFAGRVFRFK